MTGTNLFDLKNKRVFVAGHNGMVGSALVRRLKNENTEVVTARRAELNLVSQTAVQKWMDDKKPELVILAAAKVGGILANSNYPAEFLYENLMIEANVIHAAHLAGISKLVFLGSTCIYPKFAEQPIKEEYLLTGPLEPTNEWYAIAKIAGIKLCQSYRKQYDCDFISVQPTNLYGPGDNYDLNSSHVVPALIRKAHAAKMNNAEELVVWGSGKPLREFLYVDDLADAVIHLTKKYSDIEPVNVGSGRETTIADLAYLICQIVGFKGDITFDSTKPDGTPRKLADVTRLRATGWNNARSLENGIEATYQSALAQNLLSADG